MRKNIFKTFKRSLLIIIVILFVLLTSCNENTFDLYSTIFAEMENVDTNISASDFYDISYRCYVEIKKNDNDFKKYESYSSNSCILKNDLSYISQLKTKDGIENEFNYYSVIDNEIYSIKTNVDIDKKHYTNSCFTDENKYEFNKLNDVTLKDIVGFEKPSEFKINSFNGKNGEIIQNKNNDIYDVSYILKMEYSILKDEAVLNRILENNLFNEYKNDIVEDAVVCINYYYNINNKDNYKIEIEIDCITDTQGIILKTEFIKKIHCDEVDNIDFSQNVNLYLETKENINLLSYGKTTFGFFANYSGYYDIYLDLSAEVTMIIDNEEYTGSKIKVSKLMRANEKYLIYINNHFDYTSGSIVIFYSNDEKMNNISFKENDLYVLKVKSIDGLKNLSVNNEKISIENIVCLEQTDQRNMFLSGKSSSVASYIFENDKEYLVYLKNKTDCVVENVSLKIDEIDEIKIGSSNEIIIRDNYIFYRINNILGGQYEVNVAGSDIKLQMILLDSNFNVHHGGANFNISMNSNATYYLGIVSSCEENIKIDVKKIDDEYQWEITGGKYTGYRTYEEIIELESGFTYDIKLLKNGENMDVKYYGEYAGDLLGYEMFRLDITETGKLNISNEILNEKFNWIKIIAKKEYILDFELVITPI